MINTNEIIIIVIAFGALLALALRLTRSPKVVLLLTLSMVPALFLAVEGATQFLSVDETYMVTELENVRVTKYRQWNMGSYRTSILITGSLTNLVDGLVLPEKRTDIDVVSLAKTMHWLVGFAILILIYETVRRGFIEPDQEKMFFVGFFNLSLLLPTNILAFKIVNYDLLSMMLGMLCVALTLVALKERRVRPAVLAVITGTLASQEKIIASPMLALAMFSGTFIAATYPVKSSMPEPGESDSATDESASLGMLDRIAWRRAGFVWLSLVLTSMAVVSLTWIIVDALHKGLTFNLRSAMEPLVGFIAPVLNRIPENVSPVMKTTLVTSILEPVMVFVVIGAMALLASAMFRAYTSQFRDQRLTIALFWYVCIGLTGIYAVGFVAQQFTMYLYPIIPAPAGTYIPKAFNGYSVHYMQTSELAHRMIAFLTANADMGRSIPTMFWLAVLFCLGTIAHRRMIGRIPAVWMMITGVCLVFPTLYMLTDTPVSSRYLNLFVFIVSFFGLLVVMTVLKTWSPVHRISAGAIVALGVVLELSMYRPVIASFRPFWARVDHTYATEPQRGINKGTWTGWGEEIFLAGERIAREFRKPGQSIRIYSNYYGAWLHNDTTIKIFDARTREHAVSSTDFYVLNRTDHTRYPFPFGKKPLFTIDYNGCTMAWVFRGDQLRDRILSVSREVRGGYVVRLPGYRSLANNSSQTQRSRLVLYENGKRLGPAHSTFADIRSIGEGRYCHWEDLLYFTTSDNTDPRTNGRVYSITFEQ